MRPSSRLSRGNLGFLLAKAVQRWNEMLVERFCDAGFGHVRASFGSILIPLFEEDGLRLGELAERGGISKQTMTTLVRDVEAAGFIRRTADRDDGRAARVYLTAQARRFQPVAERILADLDRAADAIGGATEAERVGRWLHHFGGA
jgi:DNA-binding MarR family transcriptional regulator